jgi:SpoIID/LytB domain protein
MMSVIRVGIVTAEQIRFRLNGDYLFGDKEFGAGEETVTATETAIRWRDQLYHEILFTPKEASNASFSLSDVTIGVNFHWQRQETQTFRGSLRLINDGGRVCAINILPLEEYLKSVISSEMSATASLPFLKAHAVISRSWLLAQIDKSSRVQGSPVTCHLSPLTSHLSPLTSLVRWYDREDHTLFDVCADDHCQRYQGISKISNPTAIQAVAETAGEVLMYDGEICDARFSKCCGGMMEEFASCWDDQQKPYLVAKPDILFDERARGVKEAFCNTSDPKILSQVLNDFDQETTDFYRWNVEYSGQELDEIVKRKSGIDFGHILSMTPIKRGPSGRIILLEIRGTKRTMTVGKELEIRKWLSPSHLYSSAFEVIPLADGFRLEGKGWGHGVGLCQIGAAVMGSLGYDYREILEHYYPGAKVIHNS